MEQTDWCVITGAPCSGKTSVVRELQRRGHRIVDEVARSFIDAELAKGRSLKEIKADVLSFERDILKRKLDIETTLPADELVFLDRAVPDSIAYFLLEGLDPVEPLMKGRIFRYRRIFLFDRLLIEHDRVRSENDAMAARIDSLLENAYRSLEYDVLRIPVLPVAQRTDYILRHL
jgi:predicted ATPase